MAICEAATGRRGTTLNVGERLGHVLSVSFVAKSMKAGLDSRRICLITPGHLSTNPRLTKEADALAAEGYSVEVVSCDYQDWARRADEDFSARPWRRSKRVRFGPMSPVPLRVRQGVRLRVSRWLFSCGKSTASCINSAWHPAGPELLRATTSINADLYVAHYPAALPAAAVAASRHYAAYAYDAEDFHLGDSPEKQEFDLLRRLTRAIEDRYLYGAKYVTAASPGIADAYVEAYGVERPKVLLNVFPRNQTLSAPTLHGEADPSPSLYWFSQTIGPNRGLETAIHAISRARSRPHLYLRGQLAADYEARLDGLAQSFGTRERLHILPPAPPSQMVRLAARYDVGLASEAGHTPNNKLALSNKLFTYLLAGLPVVASDTPAQTEFAKGKESCVKVYPMDDPVALTVAIDDLLLDSNRLSKARATAFELGQSRFNWDVESRKMVDLVRGVLSETCSSAA
jgi:glycosyltransferase involved in cell wall biosynthesis